MNFLILFTMLIAPGNDVTEDWVTVEPPRIGVRVKMPSQPLFREQIIQPVREQEPITVRTRSSISANGKENYTFVYHDEKQIPRDRRQVVAILDGAVTGAIALVNGELIREGDIFVEKHKGRDFEYRCEIDDAKLQTTHKLRIRSKIVLVGNRLFSLNYIAEENSYKDSQANAYFKSFELIKTPRDMPPKPRVGRARELAEEK